MTWKQFGMVVAVASAMTPSPALAEWALHDNAVRLIRKVGVHGNLSFRQPLDPDVTKGLSVGPSVGLSPGRQGGIKFPFKVGLFSENLHSQNGETFAVMHTKAVMGGIGYGWHTGALSTSVALMTGYAFNSGQLAGNVPLALGVQDSAGTSVHVGNAVLIRPRVSAEYFLSRTFTVRLAGDYTYMRPDIVVTTPNGRIAGQWDPSNVQVTAGIGWYPFRK